MGLRLIAVNDNYDTLDKDSSDNEIVVPFKNLINDAYCRDISLKIRSHLDVKRKDGQFIGSFAMYGYKKTLTTKPSGHRQKMRKNSRVDISVSSQRIECPAYCR